ncbi:helix-turn-helix domain-containing protein [Spongiimicrobium salis]|uniref:helix-turn-helix domain-containing protein n=1 Tax=Spongiimicrobium salis TaxID=1667022 RepID=UPI00374DD694
MILNFWNSILLVGIIQGVISFVLLYRNLSNAAANRILAWIILLISMACLNIFLLETLQDTSTLWNIIEAVFPLVIIMPIGPLLYFYCRALLHPNFSWNTKRKLHFLPILLDLIPYLTAVVYIIGVLLGAVNPNNNTQWGNFIDDYSKFVDIPRWISLSIYLGLLRRILQGVPKQIQQSKSYAWTKQLLYGFSIFQILWLLHLILYILPYTSNILLREVGWYPIYVSLMVMVYWLGIKGYFVGHLAGIKPVNSVNKKLIQPTMKTLEIAMLEERLFLNPSLKLQHIAKHTGISQKVISGVLNQHLHKGFNEYVNEFRVEELKKRLLDPEYQHLTITGIALECGFNSQATFQRSFKLMTKQSPREYRETHLRKEA